MNLRALDNLLLRLAAARSGAVAGVKAVSRSEAARSVDPARVTDPRWLEIPRPDPAAIPPGDIARFQALVREAGGFAGVGATTGLDVPAQIEGPLLPADRIVITLRQLGRVHGL